MWVRKMTLGLKKYVCIVPACVASRSDIVLARIVAAQAESNNSPTGCFNFLDDGNAGQE